MIFHESTEFVRNLDKFLFNASVVSSAYLNSNKTRIPTLFRSYSQTLYRGQFFNQKEYIQLTEGKFKFGRVTSWSKDRKVAEKFLNDPQYIYQSKGKEKIILLKEFQVSDIILDIDAYVSFYGEKRLVELGFDELNIDSALKEQEVLIAPIKINKDEFVKI